MKKSQKNRKRKMHSGYVRTLGGPYDSSNNFTLTIDNKTESYPSNTITITTTHAPTQDELDALLADSLRKLALAQQLSLPGIMPEGQQPETTPQEKPIKQLPPETEELEWDL